MLLSSCSNNERLQAWYQCNSWMVKRCQKFFPCVFVVHSLSYTLFCWLKYIGTIVNLLNINGDAAIWLFKWWTPQSLIPIHFLDGEEMPKIFSGVFVVHSHSYTPFCFSIIPAIVIILNINGDSAVRLFKRWMPQRMVPMHLLGCEKLTKICYKCVRRTQL